MACIPFTGGAGSPGELAREVGCMPYTCGEKVIQGCTGNKEPPTNSDRWQLATMRSLVGGRAPNPEYTGGFRDRERQSLDKICIGHFGPPLVSNGISACCPLMQGYGPC